MLPISATYSIPIYGTLSRIYEGKNEFDIPNKLRYLIRKLNPCSGGFGLKREFRENRERPRRCDRGRNLSEPLP